MVTASSRRGTLRTIGDRIAWLVEQFAQGSVRGAAELWEIQRLTLQRLIKGQVRNPRGLVFERIAEACGTTVGWLRTGKGPAPTTPAPAELLMTPWHRRWRRQVEELGLSEAVRERVVALPGLMRRVFYVMVLRGHPVGAPIGGMDAARRAEEFEYRAWVALITGLIETYGRERVRAKLEAERLWLDLQFNPVAISRYIQDGVAQRPESDPVRRQWSEVLHRSHEIAPELPTQAPSLARE